MKPNLVIYIGLEVSKRTQILINFFLILHSIFF